MSAVLCEKKGILTLGWSAVEITKDGGPPLEKSRTKLSSVSSTDTAVVVAGLLLRPAGSSGMPVITYKCVAFSFYSLLY